MPEAKCNNCGHVHLPLHKFCDQPIIVDGDMIDLCHCSINTIMTPLKSSAPLKPSVVVKDDGNIRIDNLTLGSQPLDPPVMMTVDMDDEAWVAAAKAVLKQHDYVVVKTKSHQAAQQRLAIAKVREQCAQEDAQSARHWAQTELGNEIRDLRARCTYLYGLAAKLGATREQLSGQN